MLTSRRVASIQRALLGWGEAHAQPFPWRDARDPYSALVAGVCSQQTQMARVLPLWERWMAAFPSLEVAAEAEAARLLHVWGRAGYPRRALALREACRRAMREHGGALPRDPAALLALPGVGPFTAAIVRCFGWGDEAAAIDTNVVRVLGRLVHADLQPARETSPRAIAETAERLLPRGANGEAGHWNAVLMDYGAQVCTPKPRCGECVVRRWCAARPRFEAGASAEPVRAQPRFAGSMREWRGRILRALREADAAGRAPRLATLVAGLAADEGEAATVRRLFEALCAEGLAWSRGGRCGLGDAPAARRTL